MLRAIEVLDPNICGANAYDDPTREDKRRRLLVNFMVQYG